MTLIHEFNFNTVSMKTKIYLIFFVILFGCATPAEIQHLSEQQVKYFDVAINSVVKQSEALIIAAEKLVEKSDERIKELEAENRKLFEEMILDTITDPQQAKAIIQEIVETVQSVEEAKTKHNADVEKIKQKTAEIGEYLAKMKEVQVALNAYIQSEKMGEAVVNDILKLPSVNFLLNTVDELTPKIQDGLTEIKTLITGIN